MGLAGASSADQHCITLLGDTVPAGKLVDECLLDRRTLKLKYLLTIAKLPLAKDLADFHASSGILLNAEISENRRGRSDPASRPLSVGKGPTTLAKRTSFGQLRWAHTPNVMRHI